MGNANSGNVRDRHKSGDSLPPSSPCGLSKDGQAFSFDKRPSVTSPSVIPAPSSLSSGHGHGHSLGSVTGGTHAKIILQHSQSNDEDSESPSYISKSLSKADSEDYPELGRPRASTLSEGTGPLDRSDPLGIDDRGQKILPTVFKWDGGGRSAFICGTFSDWKTIPMVKSNFTAKEGDDFVAIIDLPEGEYQYKYLIDEEWKHNPSEQIIETENGTINNIITVSKTDFEVFDALAMDQCNSKSKTTQLISGSPPGSEWGQEIPSYKPWEKTTGPPILPPHLLQVILNKDTPLSCEPTLLPEPNHVMLNHLYALSIKDGVMVLSATHRYRKKYVTTLLYKPI